MPSATRALSIRPRTSDIDPSSPHQIRTFFVNSNSTRDISKRSVSTQILPPALFKARSIRRLTGKIIALRSERDDVGEASPDVFDAVQFNIVPTDQLLVEDDPVFVLVPRILSSGERLTKLPFALSLFLQFGIFQRFPVFLDQALERHSVDRDAKKRVLFPFLDLSVAVEPFGGSPERKRVIRFRLKRLKPRGSFQSPVYDLVGRKARSTGVCLLGNRHRPGEECRCGH